MIKTFKDYFVESINIYDINPFDKLDGKTLIFFDTETTGLNPNINQITEIAAIAINGDTFDQIETFNKFIKLSDHTLEQIKIQKSNPSPNKKNKSIEELLVMSDYKQDLAEKYEAETLVDFAEFIDSFDNSVLIAHNATFDMKMINTKLKKQRITLTNYKVLDTMMFARLILIPAMQSLANKGDENAQQLVNMLKKPNSTSKEGLHNISSSLGNLNQLVKSKLDKIQWHSGLSDVQVTIELFKFIKEYYDKHSSEKEEPLFKKAYARAKTRPF